MVIDEILRLEFAGNTGQAYLIALGVMFVVFLGFAVFKAILLARLKHIAKRTKTSFDDALIEFVESIHWPFYVIIAAFAGIHALAVENRLYLVISYMFFLGVVFYGVKGIQKVIQYFVEKEAAKRSQDPKESASLVRVLGVLVSVLIWIIALLLVLSNFGIDITSLIAGLGIGGIAIAFALQNILEDIFSAFTIYFDKPFREGDFIVIGTDQGTVKHVGIKTTRLQTLQGQELVISNRELTSTRINNYKKMEKRRVVFNFGVTYSTPLAKLKKINDIVRKIFKEIDVAELDRVHFSRFGDSSLLYEVVYHINSNEYLVYMDTQQDVNLQLKAAFEKEKIEFAFPSQTIYLAK